MKKSSILILMVCLMGVLMTDAHAQKKLTQEDIDTYGTKIFDEPDQEKMFKVVKEVLLAMDFEIELENPAKGLIKTKRKVIGETGIATGQSSAQFRLNYRQYYAYISEAPEGKVKVVFMPRIYIGDADLTDKKVWVLKGAAGEYKLWENLFNNIAERL
jgi:hypothetical protein